MEKLTTQQIEILAAINAAGGQISASGLMRLIAATNKIEVPTFTVLHNYTSDKSGNTELADYELNIGVKYENAKESTFKKVDQLDEADIMIIEAMCNPTDIKGFEYIDRKGMTEADYCKAVIAAIPTAIAELLVVKPRTNDAVVHINKVLSFNENTGNLLIYGELLKGGKKTTVKGAIKLVGKAPKTVAKEVVNSYLSTRASKIRSYNISNLNTISINHEKITLVEV